MVLSAIGDIMENNSEKVIEDMNMNRIEKNLSFIDSVDMKIMRINDDWKWTDHTEMHIA
tara:strand:+ start:100 stop:276 length:177 start_codon:yes stop_codon:yes gene_type:complete